MGRESLKSEALNKLCYSSIPSATAVAFMDDVLATTSAHPNIAMLHKEGTRLPLESQDRVLAEQAQPEAR